MSSKVSGEVRALKDQLSTYTREIEVNQQQLEELSILKEQFNSLQRDHNDLQSKMEGGDHLLRAWTS